ARKLLRREPRPRVLDRELAGPRAHRDRPAARREPERVLDEVRRGLEDAVGVAERRRRVGRVGLEPDAAEARLGLEPADDVARRLGEVELVEVDGELALAHPTEV